MLAVNTRRADVAKSAAALPVLVSAGFGLLWGSLALRSVGNFSESLSYADAIGKTGVLASNIVEILLCAIVVSIARLVDQEKLRKGVVIASIAITALLMLAIVLAGACGIPGSGSGLLSAVLAFLLGCSSVLPLMLWGSCFAAFDRETSMRCMLGSSLFGMAIYLAISCVPNSDVRWFLEKLSSLGSLGVYLAALPLIGGSAKTRGAKGAGGKVTAFFAEQAAICCGLGFAIALSGMFRSSGINLALSLLALAVLVGIAFALRSRIMQLHETLLMFIPMGSCLVIAIPFAGAELPRVALAIPAIIYISWLTLVFVRFSEIRAAFGIEPLLLVALTLFVARLSNLAARIVASYALSEGVLAGLDVAVAFDILLAMACVTVAYATFRLLNLSNQSLKERVTREFVETEGSGRELAVKKIAASYGLTKRECEVFVLMAQGHTRKFIAERFAISEGTVRTHIANIYKKTGCSSKEEIIALADSLGEV